jgi:hypothetical protein
MPTIWEGAALSLRGPPRVVSAPPPLRAIEKLRRRQIERLDDLQPVSDCAGRWMERDRPSSSSRSAGLAKVETRRVPSPKLLKSLAGATGLEPATSGVTGHLSARIRKLFQ